MTRAQVEIASGSVPHVVPVLLRELYRFSSSKAERIACVNYWVLAGIRKNEIKDSEMVSWLLDDVIRAFNEVAPASTRFGVRGDRWGYWTDGDGDEEAQ